MKPLSVLKKDLEFNRGLFSLVETLKTIAVAQYKSLEQQIKDFSDIFPAIENFFGFIDIKKVRHPFLNPEGQRQAVIAITSDTGLLGGLNVHVVEKAISELEAIPGKLIVVGDRGKAYARETRMPFTAFSGIRDEERYGQAMQLRNYALKGVLDGSYGYLKVVYPRPVSFTVQRIETFSFVPFTPPKTTGSAQQGISNIIMESSTGDMAGYLVYLLAGEKLYEIFGLSRLAEFAARFVHLEESSQKLKDMEKKLQLEYFRVRHELIDRNMRELFAARALFSAA